MGTAFVLNLLYEIVLHRVRKTLSLMTVKVPVNIRTLSQQMFFSFHFAEMAHDTIITWSRNKCFFMLLQNLFRQRVAIFLTLHHPQTLCREIYNFILRCLPAIISRGRRGNKVYLFMKR